MRDKKILFEKLDLILRKMVRYSFTLGDWGKHVWIVIYLRDNGYNSRSFCVRPSEIERYESQKICMLCFENIYNSKYDYNDYITDIYNINFNPYIRESMENIEKVEDIIRNIEALAINTYNMVVNSYLDPSNDYKKISIYFKRDVLDYNGIIGEIKESIIFGRSISENYKFRDQPVFTFTALKEKKRGINNDEIELSYPDYYTFSFIIYRINH
jgi:hypothetical protein